MINTKEAAWLLGVGENRVRDLLKTGRIEGAQKVDGCWQIPVGEDGIPVVSKGTRGPEATWSKVQSISKVKGVTRVHVDTHIIRDNSKLKNPKPPILVRKGKIVTHHHQVIISGTCKIVYRPDRPLSSSGAKVWIELSPNCKIIV